MRIITILFLLSLTVGTHGQGTVLWNESVHGPISDDYNVPTQMGTLTEGTNSIIATISTTPVGNTWLINNDYFNFSVAAGFQVQSLLLTIDNVGVLSWIGSPGFGLPTFGASGGVQTGELLSQMSTLSIPCGTYGMYMENYNFQPVPAYANYRLDFVVTAVPEPSTWALLTLGGARLWPALRRRSKASHSVVSED